MIKSYFFLILLCLPVLLNAKTINVKIKAPSLMGSQLGTSTERNIQIYLPPSYSSTTKLYPVVYFLAGYGAKAEEYEPLHQRIEELSNNKKIAEMIFVFVDAFDPLLGSFYVNSELHGNWESYIAEDLVQYIDAHYRTKVGPKYRGISGHSMGGFGSIYVGQKHHTVFGGIYAVSPPIFRPHGFNNSFLANNWQAIARFNTFMESLNGKSPNERQRLFYKRIKNINKNDNKDYDGFYETFLYAYGGAFAPIKQAPFSIHPSTSGKSGFAKWQNGFGGITEKLITHSKSASNQKIRIDYGTKDQFLFIREGGAYLTEKIGEQEKVKITAFNGGHSNKLEDRFVSYMLPFFDTQFRD